MSHKPYTPVVGDATKLAIERYWIMHDGGLEAASVTMPADLMADVMEALRVKASNDADRELFYDFVNYLYYADSRASGPKADPDEYRDIGA